MKRLRKRFTTLEILTLDGAIADVIDAFEHGQWQKAEEMWLLAIWTHDQAKGA